MITLNETIHGMLVENTGVHICDSGGGSGRHWQQNQGLTMADFDNLPPAKLSFEYDYPEVTVSVWHKLTSGVIELDDLCREFNALPCPDWESDIHGVSCDQNEWLHMQGFEIGNSWNTYNWDNQFDQILQGCDLKFDGLDYVLIQIHGGADARGGYTDAKLFKVDEWRESYSVIDDACGFCADLRDADGEQVTLCYTGEFINTVGGPASDADIEEFRSLLKGTYTVGDIYE